MSKLREKMIRAMELKNLSKHSQKAYLAAVTGLAKHYHKSPQKITKHIIEDYLLYLKKQPLEVAHILQKHMGDYQNQYHLWGQQKKIVTDLLNCRPAHLGGHIDRCDNCGTVRIIYHSCRNRHCPKCQHMLRERWLEKRKEEILPLSYFHVVFTLPHELYTIILNNKKVMLNGLFTATSKTLLTFGKNELDGTPVFLAILHSWDQKLKAHFHLHCLVAGGAVSKDKKRWLPVKNNYLFNEKALSRVFRGKFIDRIGVACQKGSLNLAGHKYKRLKHTLFTKTWVVSVRDPVKCPEHVLAAIKARCNCWQKYPATEHQPIFPPLPHSQLL